MATTKTPRGRARDQVTKPDRKKRAAAPEGAAAKAPGKIGRPTKYRPEFLGQARKLAAMGHTEAEIASFFEVHVRNFRRWKISHPELAAALVPGKAEAIEQVTKSLFRQAVGYSHDAVKIMLGRDGKPVIVNYVEQVPANVAAGIFWLKNVDPEHWRDRREYVDPSVEGVTIKGGLPDDEKPATPAAVPSAAPTETAAPDEPSTEPAAAPAETPSEPNADG